MRKILYCCVVILTMTACKEKYEPPIKAPATGYLVVEGYISASGPAEIRLSRTIELDKTARIINETAAKVQLQGRDNSMYVLTEGTGGLYTNALLNLNTNQQYRLYIKTKDGKEYASDYVKVRKAPAIDAVSWTRENGGVQLYANTHDADNNTWYYRWTTEEAWEFHARYYTRLDFLRDGRNNIIGVKYRRPDMQVEEKLFTCWQYENSTSLLLGSSAKLSADTITFPLTYIQPNTWKLGVLYTILVKQYALTKEEYEYLLKMKRNSEETGSIFDRQPSELKGNIHCLSQPDEPVIGFIGIANRQEKRIWIKRSDVPDWNYRLSCDERVIPSDSAQFFTEYMPVTPESFNNMGMITSYIGATPSCVDCTINGTNVKPSFWP
jgi:hypothetical protein